MRIEPLGDTAHILRALPASAAAVARWIEMAGLPGVLDVVPCAETVGVYFSTTVSESLLRDAVSRFVAEPVPTITHRIPICYEMGADLEETAANLGLSRQDFVGLHASSELRCFAIGFCPGFAYLGPLPDALQGVARLPTPRTRTASGSVGITGNQTAVYPLVRPGGWPIIGMTPLTLVDDTEGYFPISVGDRVQFVPISEAEFKALFGCRL